MRKLNIRYLWTAGAGALIAAAAIAIPAWAAGGGGSGAQAQSQAQGKDAPMPPPPGAPGFAMRGHAPSAAEIKQTRAKLDKFASCLRDHGIDVPKPGSSAGPPSPPSSSERAKITKDCGTPPAPPGRPPLGNKQMEEARKAMAKGHCPPRPAPPARNNSK